MGWAVEEIQTAALKSELHRGQGLHKDVAGYENMRPYLKDTLLSPQQPGGRRHERSSARTGADNKHRLWEHSKRMSTTEEN